MDGWDDRDLELASIFFPYAFYKMKGFSERDGKFVHYTSASVAMSILQRREVWMRQATTMNDFLEIEYGLSRLSECYKSDAGQELISFIDRIFPRLCAEVAKLFDDWQPAFRLETYLTCISEHLDNEDSTGRLSMWRAYGGRNSVAIVMNNGPFLRPSDAMRAYTSPVSYSSSPQFRAQFKQVLDGLKNNETLIAKHDRKTISHNLFEMFRFAALCTKHPGFHEEREWRVIYSPKISKSDKLISDIQTVDGIPQRIFKIPLKNFPNEGFYGAEPEELISKIIIGPTEYPYAVAEAFIEMLSKAGVSSPRSKVVVSDIPLRR